MRNVIFFIAFALLAMPALASAAQLGTIKVDKTGTVQAGGRTLTDVVSASAAGETILLPLGQFVPAGRDGGSWTLELPVVMRADWQPELIANRCACQTDLIRTGAQTFDLTFSGLVPGGDVILRADFPAGTLALGAGQRIREDLGRASPWLLGLAAVLLLASLGLLGWMARELAAFRKFKLTPQPVMAPPNELPPAMVSLLPSGKISAATMAALLVSLASRGYLTIVHKGQDFTLAQDRQLDLSGPGFALGSAPGDTIPESEVRKATKEGVTVAEKFLIAKLFTQGAPAISREELKSRLSRHLESAKIGKVYAGIYREATTRGFFINNPHAIHLRYRAVGIGIFYAGLAGLAGSFLLGDQPLFLPLAWAAIALAGYVVTRMVPYLPLLTVAGQAEFIRWAGFRAYLTDPRPLDPQTSSSQFFAYLPYALAWGALPAWTKRFGERPVKAPSWYLTEPATRPVPALAAEIGHIAAFLGSLLAAIHEHTTK